MLKDTALAHQNGKAFGHTPRPELLNVVKSRRLYDRIVTKHVGQLVSMSRRIGVRIQVPQFGSVDFYLNIYSFSSRPA